jgi:xanthosine utilization system XapX-like protein
LFPSRRPRWPARDYAIIGVLGVLVATSIYQLFWVKSLLAG